FDRMYAQNVKTLPAYYEAIDAGQLATHVGFRLSDDDLIRRDVIMTLMCDFELDKRAIEKKWHIVFDDYFHDVEERLRELIDDDLVSVTDERITVNGMGILVIRNAAMAFDAYLPKQMEKPIFSKTV
ncbi:MAG: coproporphyrinogen III oxidase, partial [Bacteroidetes bacterium]|nr:coproporphyrinogen III oxidase [Bacteroidota bacterium]